VKLSFVIPAYNEEEAIAAIIERCLAERENIVRETPVEAVEVIVVNDGSHDRTAEIAGQFREITLISHPKNRGYGAAIKSGFEKATGTIVAFLDADGTCDPRYFIDMCRKLVAEDADIVIGSRMTHGSRMPFIRKVGNRFYALLINLLGNTSITDSASGMRVIKKTSLKKLYPLPDGLHFTPAMSCRAVLDHNLTIAEIPMTYEERVGRSKLGVVQDGIRFLKTIVDIALTYAPFKFFGITGIVMFLAGFLYGLYPLVHYLRFRMVPDYMIYRLVTVMVLIVTSIGIFTVGIISDEVIQLMYRRNRQATGFKAMVFRALSQRTLIIAGAAVALFGIALNYKTIWKYFTTGTIDLPWVYVVAGAFLVMVGLQAVALGIVRRILTLLRRTEEARSTTGTRSGDR
jgi:glycosyltransferase involved in cell wall biosynthesis